MYGITSGTGQNHVCVKIKLDSSLRALAKQSRAIFNSKSELALRKSNELLSESSKLLDGKKERLNKQTNKHTYTYSIDLRLLGGLIFASGAVAMITMLVLSTTLPLAFGLGIGLCAAGIGLFFCQD